MICMRNGMRSGKVVGVLRDIHGAGGHIFTTVAWYKIYIEILRKFLAEVQGTKIGGVGEVVAIDETYMQRQRIGRKCAADYKGERNKATHILKKLPGRTVWKRPSTKSILKRPAHAMASTAST